MDVFEPMRAAGHEQVVFCHDRALGLRAIVALHDTTLGPGAGGIRVREYAREADALTDALRLSEAMTYKASLAELNLGGGKAVVLGPLSPENRVQIFRALGRFVESLGGRYVATEDMGVTHADIEVLRQISAHGVGRDIEHGGAGDPGPVTGWGVFCGMRAVLAAAGMDASFAGKRVAVQGAGSVGLTLTRHLLEAGAQVIAADVEPGKVEAARELGAEIAAPEEILRVACDVLAPCAAGAVLNEASIPELQCGAVAGGANNQLATEEDGQRLHQRGIVYAPDFIINAGGLINVADELEPGGFDRQRVHARVARIEPRLEAVFDEARRTGETPESVALARARRRIEAARGAG